MHSKNDQPRGRVLIVDDEEPVLRALSRVVGGVGHEVVSASGAAEAEDRVRRGGIEVIVSDLRMPGRDGLALLKTVHAHEPDIPVILLTGTPDVGSAAQAVAFGAFDYLVKPVDASSLCDAIQRALDSYRIARLEKEALAIVTERQAEVDERAALQQSFDRAVASIHLVYQPIVSAERACYGHEVFVRTREPSLPNPGALFAAAERLDRVIELGRVIRALAARAFGAAADPDPGTLFVNLHPFDLLDEFLISGDPLSCFAPRVVLEITERASLDAIPDVQARVARLRALGFSIAIDDLGAGYAGLSSFARLEPNTVKFDMALVRDVDHIVTKQKLIRSMTDLCHDMGIKVVAEGVERAGERDALIGLGCDFLQGYLFARPGPPLPTWTWGD